MFLHGLLDHDPGFEDPDPYKLRIREAQNPTDPAPEHLPLKATKLGMFLHGLLDHDPGDC
jgi:hypothetical protein